jgi:hypothetical protein
LRLRRALTLARFFALGFCTCGFADLGNWLSTIPLGDPNPLQASDPVPASYPIL